jgi:hypothetical protein
MDDSINITIIAYPPNSNIPTENCWFLRGKQIFSAEFASPRVRKLINRMSKRSIRSSVPFVPHGQDDRASIRRPDFQDQHESVRASERQSFRASERQSSKNIPNSAFIRMMQCVEHPPHLAHNFSHRIFSKTELSNSVNPRSLRPPYFFWRCFEHHKERDLSDFQAIAVPTFYRCANLGSFWTIST